MVNIEEMREYRARMNEKVLASGNLEIQRFFALDDRAYKGGALPVKTKELMGLVASVVLRCNECIFYHMDRCVGEEVPPEEIHEALSIALVVGGSITIPHIRFAFEAMDALLEERES
ncbi:MAG: carboxymuconolactone decarboxylase family protein [Thermoplasmata archaeon]